MEQKRSKTRMNEKRRENLVAKLAKKNREYAYVYQKKYPDSGLGYRAWINLLAKENKI